MRKSYIISFLLLSFLFCFAITNAQEMASTVIKSFQVPDINKIDTYTFNEGDEVTIYGYKKKNDIYHFIVSTDVYAGHIETDIIPFAVHEKQLKKLPNALSSEMSKLEYNMTNDLIAKKKYEVKQNALNGKYMVILDSDNMLVSQYDINNPELKISAGDTIYILGYSKNDESHLYTIYNDRIAGIYETPTSFNPFENVLNLYYMPSTTDTDVQLYINKKRQEIEKRKKEEFKKAYQENALKGNLKAVINNSRYYGLEIENTDFAYGDTVSVIGYSNEDYKKRFAIYNDKGAGILATRYSSFDREPPLKSISGEINYNMLLPANDERVEDIIIKQRQRVDSIHIEKYRKSHVWLWVPVDKTWLDCSLCDYKVYNEDSIACLAYIDDTLYHIKSNVLALDEEYLEIHKLAVPRELQSNRLFKLHMETFADSLQTEARLSIAKNAELLNSVNYLKCIEKVEKLAPYGYFEEWGWDNDYGSVSFHFNYTNTNKKTIKYIDVYWKITNDVDDVRKTGHFQGTGPLEEWNTGRWSWDYSSYYVAGDATHMQITKVILTYMNGSQKVLTGSSIQFK